MDLKSILIFLLIGIYQLSLAQSAIKGTILDNENDSTLAFVNIAIKGASGGTISNSDGEFIFSISNLNAFDTILFSHIGYETKEIPLKEIKENIRVHLNPKTVQLSEVKIYSRELTAEEIIDKVNLFYAKNHPKPPLKRQIFIHNFVRTPFDARNNLKLIRSDFPGFDKAKFSKMINQIPKEFVNYNDALVQLYYVNDKWKIIPIKGISLQESGQDQYIKQIEADLSEIINDFQASLSDKDIYYKFRTGILSSKLDNNSSGEDYEKPIEDENYYRISSYSVKNEIAFLLKEYASIEGENLEFLLKPHLYNYQLSGLEYLNSEVVYKIDFKAKSKGLYEGQIFISSSSFAILQMDFEFMKGKKSENIHLFGMGHSLNYKKGKVIYEKFQNEYHVKYIYAEEIESVSFERSFLFMKKKKRFLIDKELNEMKFDAKLFFDMHRNWEMLVLDQYPINPNSIEDIKEPKYMDFKKENSFSNDIWLDKTIISPSKELQSYQRK